MEALALMLIHLLTPGGLSWTRNGVPKTDIAHNRVKREKQAARPEDLCRGLPGVFEEFLRACRRLKFTEKPDYEYWREEFMDLVVANGFPRSDAFVWPPPEPKVRLNLNIAEDNGLMFSPANCSCDYSRSTVNGRYP